MPWVATDKADGKVYIYASEPVLRKDAIYFDNGDDCEFMNVDDFPNPTAPGEKREFKWADVVSDKLEHNQVCPNCESTDTTTKEPPRSVELAAMQEEIRERLQPGPIVRMRSLDEFSDEERPVSASRLASIFTGAAQQSRVHGWSVELLLEIVAERIRDAAGLPQGKT